MGHGFINQLISGGPYPVIVLNCPRTARRAIRPSLLQQRSWEQGLVPTFVIPCHLIPN